MNRRHPSVSLSIHDVMPSTIANVQALVNRLRDADRLPVTLLVVPGQPWTDSQLEQLHAWEDEGFPLAGHGWSHRCETFGGLSHRLHAFLLSRNVAEHLALSPAGRVELIQRCYDWFRQQGFRAPTLYVPPAWALGRLPPKALGDLPFQEYEVLSGILDAETGRIRKLPLVGYEADTSGRAAALRLLNACNLAAARWLDLPVRVGIHPFDLEYRLEADLKKLILKERG